MAANLQRLEGAIAISHPEETTADDILFHAQVASSPGLITLNLACLCLVLSSL